MRKFRVHVYREMRLVFEGIEADTPQAAAHIAAEKHFDHCDDWSDCEGTNLAALVDEDNAANPDEAQDGIVVDFEDGRMLRSSYKLLAALNTLLPEIDAEIEQRRHGGNDEDWKELKRLSDEAHSAAWEAAEGAACPKDLSCAPPT